MITTTTTVVCYYTVLVLLFSDVVVIVGDIAITPTMGEEVQDSRNTMTLSQLEKNVPGFGSPVPTIGYNIEGNSVFTNFVNFYNDEQVSDKLCYMMHSHDCAYVCVCVCVVCVVCVLFVLFFD